MTCWPWKLPSEKTFWLCFVILRFMSQRTWFFWHGCRKMGFRVDCLHHAGRLHPVNCYRRWTRWQRFHYHVYHCSGELRRPCHLMVGLFIPGTGSVVIYHWNQPCLTKVCCSLSLATAWVASIPWLLDQQQNVQRHVVNWVLQSEGGRLCWPSAIKVGTKLFCWAIANNVPWPC